MKHIIYTACLVSLCSLAQVSYAQEGTTAGARVETRATTSRPIPRPLPPVKEAREDMQQKREQIKTEVKEKREDMKNTISERREEMKDKREENREEMRDKRTENKINAVHLRFKATIERQEGIIARIESRLAKIKAEGGNTAEADKILAEAKGHIAEAKTALENLKNLVNTDTNASTTPQATFEVLKNAANEIQKHLKASQDSLSKLVDRMKGIKTKVELKATTTSSKTN